MPSKVRSEPIPNSSPMFFASCLQPFAIFLFTSRRRARRLMEYLASSFKKPPLYSSTASRPSCKITASKASVSAFFLLRPLRLVSRQDGNGKKLNCETWDGCPRPGNDRIRIEMSASVHECLRSIDLPPVPARKSTLKTYADARKPSLLRDECTGTSVTHWTGDIRYKSLAELRA
jgi:hypothetical protein